MLMRIGRSRIHHHVRSQPLGKRAAFSLIELLVALTILLASAVMFAIKPWLAALALLPVPFVVMAAARSNPSDDTAMVSVTPMVSPTRMSLPTLPPE